MNDNNPYLAPAADLAGAVTSSPAGDLAGRWRRLGAALLDALINYLIILPVMYAVGTFGYTRLGMRPPFAHSLGIALFGFFVYALVHGYFLQRDGQTIGKKLLGIRISDMQEVNPGLKKILLLRVLPISAVAMIPIVGPFLAVIDSLFIFGPNRRCVHDLIAGTKVVRVPKS